jgi:hypothetical protein
LAFNPAIDLLGDIRKRSPWKDALQKGSCSFPWGGVQFLKGLVLVEGTSHLFIDRPAPFRGASEGRGAPAAGLFNEDDENFPAGEVREPADLAVRAHPLGADNLPSRADFKPHSAMCLAVSCTSHI